MNEVPWDWDEARACAMLDALALITDEPPGLTRTFLSPAHTEAKRQVAAWMHEAGLAVYEDAAGNLIGRLAAESADAPVFACGSHIDTVRNAGFFDGALGVVLAVVAAAQIARSDRPRTKHLEVIAFSDEEGVRFGSTYLGSKFRVGTLRPEELATVDADGVSIAEAMAGHTPAFPPPPRPASWAGYLEAHIEQGPVLEHTGLALGVVTAVAGQTRARVTVRGRAGHAGTTPMSLRCDALAGAAECITRLESLARASDDVVATVGELRIRDAASNVIPGELVFSVDIRHASNDVRMRFTRDAFAEIEQLLAARNLTARIEFPMVQAAVPCDPDLTTRLARCVQEVQPRICPRLVSGAGHDLVAMAAAMPAALLFVRCRDGISHNPNEFAAPADIALALQVMTRFLSEEVA